MTEADNNTMRNSAFQAFSLADGYRCYITPEFWLITYRDQDLIKIMRNTEARPGFVLLIVEFIFMALWGKRTELRERWALYESQYAADAHELDMGCKAARNRVMEFNFVKTGSKLIPTPKGNDDGD